MRGLKAKRSSRRRDLARQRNSFSSAITPVPPQAPVSTAPPAPAGSVSSVDGDGRVLEVIAVADDDDATHRARVSADEADALARGLRRGLELRDGVVASADAGDLCRGIWPLFIVVPYLSHTN